MIVIFFLINSILVIVNRSPKYIFIRLLLFFISLVFIPQAILILEIKFYFIESIETWGVFSLHLYSIYDMEYIGYTLSIIGIFVYGIYIIFVHARMDLNLLRCGIISSFSMKSAKLFLLHQLKI